MTHIPDLTIINARPSNLLHKEALRFIICGCAGSGKNALVARLPYESEILFKHQLFMLDAGSKEGGININPDATTLAQGVVTEHDQGEAAASIFASDVAIILIDASKGVLTQDCQHSHLVSLLGIRKVILVTNKMDLVGYSGTVFHSIVDEYSTFARLIGLELITAIPLSALRGDNITEQGDYMPWYHGITLMDCLHKMGVDIAREDAIPAVDAPPSVADQFEATIVWMNESPMLPGRSYLLMNEAQRATATITDIKYQVSIGTSEQLAAKKLECNAVGVCNISTDRPIIFDSYKVNRNAGGFILVDRVSNSPVGIVLLHFALRRAQNIHMQQVDVNKAVRATSKGQKPCVLWFTGLSGSGKSTIANIVEKRLHTEGRHTYLLDGDNVRHGLNKNLGFTDVDRVENIRRVAEVAKLMVDAGLIVLVAFISPFRSERRMARELLEEGEFVEIFVDTPLAIAEERDPKGLYRKARRGDLKNFTGIDSPYEAPQSPEIHLNTTIVTPEQAAELVVTFVQHETD